MSAVKKFANPINKKVFGGDSISLTGSSSAKRAQGRQETQIAEQKNREVDRLAETEDEIGRGKLLRKRGGRRSLIASR